jgi:hypothetical protein
MLGCRILRFVAPTRAKPTPYMDDLRFTPDGGTSADPDEPVLSD